MTNRFIPGDVVIRTGDKKYEWDRGVYLILKFYEDRLYYTSLDLETGEVFDSTLNSTWDTYEVVGLPPNTGV